MPNLPVLQGLKARQVIYDPAEKIYLSLLQSFVGRGCFTKQGFVRLGRYCTLCYFIAHSNEALVN